MTWLLSRYGVGCCCYICIYGFPTTFKFRRGICGSTLEPNDILYFFNYQIKYVLLFVI